MKKIKLMTIIGTRPEIIRLSSVIKACDRCFNNILVHTGQNYDYELNKIFFEDLNLRSPDYYLNVVGNSLGETIGNIISKSFELLSKIRPDALLILGDTNSCLSAISAKRLKIPVFHMEAGNRCFDQNVPEEINRKIIDHISDINLPYTENSRNFLLSEGIKKEYIFVTGSPMLEVLNDNKEKINNSKIFQKLGIEKGKYILVSIHREENIDLEKNFLSLMDSLNAVVEEYKIPLIFSTHPRTLNMLERKNVHLESLIKNYKPFSFTEYVNLEINSFCVLSDSGTLSEESSILNFPAVLIRTSTERPEAIEDGSIIIGGIKKDSIINSINIATKNVVDRPILPKDYIDKNVSIKVVKIIQSYKDIINRNVYHKD